LSKDWEEAKYFENISGRLKDIHRIVTSAKGTYSKERKP
jgi:hypothetical protein